MFNYFEKITKMWRFMNWNRSWTSHDNIYKWNSSEDTAGNCVTLKNLHKLCMLKMKKKTAWIFIIFFSRSEIVVRFHEFLRTSSSTKTEKLAQLHKYATNYNLFSGPISVHETSSFDCRFKMIERALSLF